MLKLACAVLSVVVLSLGACTESDEATAVETTETTQIVFSVDGMHCGGCAEGIAATVSEMDGVLACDASFERGDARVTVNNVALTPAIAEKITELGYTIASTETPDAPNG